MNKLKTTDNGGFPFVLDDLRWLLGQSASTAGIYQSMYGFFAAFGDNFIIQGGQTSLLGGVFSITEGWAFLDGEILKIEAQSDPTVTKTYLSKSTTYDSSGNKTFRSGTAYDTYQKDRAILNTSGSINLLSVSKLDDIMTAFMNQATTSLNGVLKTSTAALVRTGTNTLTAVTPDALRDAGTYGKLVTVTNNYTVADGITTVIGDGSVSGTFNITLPTPSANEHRILYLMYLTGAGGFTYTGNISGTALTTSNGGFGSRLILQSDGSTWQVLNLPYNGV